MSRSTSLPSRMATALREAMTESGVTAQRIFDGGKVSKSAVFAVLRGENARLSTLEAIADQIGCRVDFRLVPMEPSRKSKAEISHVLKTAPVLAESEVALIEESPLPPWLPSRSL